MNSAIRASRRMLRQLGSVASCEVAHDSSLLGGSACSASASRNLPASCSGGTPLYRIRPLSSQPAPSTTSCAVTLDDTAIHRMQHLLQETPGAVLRIGVDAGGCSGFQYIFNLDTSIGDDDIVCEHDHTALLVVDKVSHEFLKGATIEYAEDLMSASFRVKDNPNSEAACGCGSSFSTKVQ